MSYLITSALCLLLTTAVSFSLLALNTSNLDINYENELTSLLLVRSEVEYLQDAYAENKLLKQSILTELQTINSNNRKIESNLADLSEDIHTINNAIKSPE